eukprot:5146660-Amphidinium_carterae.1
MAAFLPSLWNDNSGWDASDSKFREDNSGWDVSDPNIYVMITRDGMPFIPTVGNDNSEWDATDPRGLLWTLARKGWVSGKRVST